MHACISSSGDGRGLSPIPQHAQTLQELNQCTTTTCAKNLALAGIPQPLYSVHSEAGGLIASLLTALCGSQLSAKR